MKLAIMQPYLFPYLGYFQLIKAVDTFVIYDDVAFISRGWINRNSILLNGKRHLITLALDGASISKRINQVRVGDNRAKLVKTVQHAYCKAPFFAEVYPLIEQTLLYEEKNLAKYVSHSIRAIADYLNIEVQFRLSSEVEKDNSLKGQDKILEICRVLGATDYINAIGGKELYEKGAFSNKAIALRFMKSREVTYRQFGNEFLPNLSIVDVLMFNRKEDIVRMLDEYDLIE